MVERDVREREWIEEGGMCSCEEWSKWGKRL